MRVGDYVRTKNGIILKIKDIEDIYTTDNEFIGMAIYDDKGHFVNDVEIIKSGSIIDVIEVGDHVNDYQVLEKEKSKHGNRIITTDLNNIYINNSNSIKSIVTKEQFESMEYKVN